MLSPVEAALFKFIYPMIDAGCVSLPRIYRDHAITT